MVPLISPSGSKRIKESSGAFGCLNNCSKLTMSTESIGIVNILRLKKI